MIVRFLLKWTAAGFGLQILFIVLFDMFVGLGNLSETGYGPWIELGESILPFTDNRLAMPLGAMVGLLFGMFVYSVVVGGVIGYLRQSQYE